jgi:hypothetical protein
MSDHENPINQDSKSQVHRPESTFSEITMTLSEAVAFVEASGDDTLKAELKLYLRLHPSGAQVRVLFPSDPKLVPVVELDFE